MSDIDRPATRARRSGARPAPSPATSVPAFGRSAGPTGHTSIPVDTTSRKWSLASATTRNPAAPFLLAQDVLLDLAGRGLGQFPELDGRGRLEVRDALAAEVDDLPLGRLLAGGELHERLGPLTPLLVGHRDDRALEHAWVAADGVLDLDSGDVLSAGDDDVFLAVADLDVPVGVHHADVT